jgi:glycosyltransferase involved in cell wall biosynthesis
MKILLINHYAGSIQHGMEFRPFYLAREWVRAGHHVQIVAASHSHIRAEQPRLSDSTMDEEIEGVRYRWYPTPPYQGNGVGRVWNILSFLRSLWHDGRRLGQEFGPDIVVASSTYPMDIWPARRIAKLANAKLIYEVHDLWPLSPIELGGMSRWHPFIVWVQMAEDYAYRHADKIVSMLPKATDYMMSRGMTPDKFRYVPNGIDSAECEKPEPLPTDVQASLLRIKAKRLPIVAYAGTHGLANALDVLLDAAHRLKGVAEFILVGPGPERERLQRRVAQERLEHVTMLPAISKRSVPTLLAEVDIAYLGLLPQPLFRFGISPNKLMDYMVAARPVVLSVAAGNDIVAEAGCGISVPPGDAAAAANAIRELVSMPDHKRRQLGAAGRDFVLQNHAYSALANKFLAGLA